MGDEKEQQRRNRKRGHGKRKWEERKRISLRGGRKRVGGKEVDGKQGYKRRHKIRKIKEGEREERKMMDKEGSWKRK